MSIIAVAIGSDSNMLGSAERIELNIRLFDVLFKKMPPEVPQLKIER